MDISKLKTPAQTRRAKALSFLPAAAWYAVIFAFSAQTGEESGRLSGEVARRSIGLLGELGEIFESDWDAFLLLTFFLRKAAHMGIYFILTALLLYGLWRAGFRSWPAGHKTSRTGDIDITARIVRDNDIIIAKETENRDLRLNVWQVFHVAVKRSHGVTDPFVARNRVGPYI